MRRQRDFLRILLSGVAAIALAAVLFTGYVLSHKDDEFGQTPAHWGILVGRVIDKDGKPISGAAIGVETLTGSKEFEEAVDVVPLTGTKGEFSINMPGG